MAHVRGLDCCSLKDAKAHVRGLGCYLQILKPVGVMAHVRELGTYQ